MVSAPEQAQSPIATRKVPSAPAHEQIYETLTVSIGIPGAMLNAMVTTACAFAGTQGHPFEAWSVAVIAWGAYAVLMGVLWAAMASDGSAR